MSDSSLVLAITRRLQNVGYRALNTPLRVASVDFEFTAALHGPMGRELDLVLIVDSTTGDYGDRDIRRVRQRIEALSRALDVTGSRYVVTAVVLGAVLDAEIDLLAETCRVLQVADLTIAPGDADPSEAELNRLDDRIRVLLPLKLPAPLSQDEPEDWSAIDELLNALPEGIDQTLVAALVKASRSGEQAVTDAVSSLIEEALRQKGQP